MNTINTFLKSIEGLELTISVTFITLLPAVKSPILRDGQIKTVITSIIHNGIVTY